MEWVGLRGANVHFAKHMKKGEKALDERSQLLEKAGLFPRAEKRRLPLRELVALRGRWP